MVNSESEFKTTQNNELELPAPFSLWEGDLGTLREPSRRALVALVRGPYLSADRHRELWAALTADETEIRSRPADLFLELEIDQTFGLAFVKGAQTFNGDAPQVVRSRSLTFIDTVLLLFLRNELVRVGSGGRVIVGKDEVVDQLQVYRKASSTDEAGFLKRINAAWTKFVDLSILVKTTTEGRFEVSPILRLVFSADEIAAVQQEYLRMLNNGEPDLAESALPDPADDVTGTATETGEESVFEGDGEEGNE